MSPTAKNLKLFRIQSDLDATVSEGDLILNFRKNNLRNTVHFSVNCTITDHAYGSFNFDSSGEFKGKIVIISSPHSLGPPAGWGQVDCWWRMSEENAVRQLNCGKCTIIAPEGYPLPKGVDAILYDGSIEDRDKKVSEYCQKHAIEQEQSALRHWQSSTYSSSLQWAKDTHQELYPNTTTPSFNHDSSVDSLLETCSIKPMLEDFRTSQSLYYTTSSGLEVLYTQKIKERKDFYETTLKDFINSHDSSNNTYSLQHYKQLLQELQSDWGRAQEIEKEKSNKIQSVQNIEDLLGSQIYLNTPPSQSYECLSAQELYEKIINKETLNTQLLYSPKISTTSWQPLSSLDLNNLILPCQSTTLTQTPIETTPAQLTQENTLANKINRHRSPSPHSTPSIHKIMSKD